MAKTPIEMMLDGVEWVAADNDGKVSDNMPYATHEGVLDLFGHKLRCYRLNTGQAVSPGMLPPILRRAKA